MGKTDWSAEALRQNKTLHQGQCCDCKIDSKGVRVWVCRVGGGVTVEQYKPLTRRWEVVEGSCNTTEGETYEPK